MASYKNIEQITERVLSVYRNWSKDSSLEQIRSDWDRLYEADISGCIVEDCPMGGVPCRWIRDSSVDSSRVIVYVHGGGFRLGSVNSHQSLMAQLSRVCNSRVVGVEYRLMPGSAYPAQLEDVDRAYRAIVDQGQKPLSIALIGDSAGGNLVAALLNKMKQEHRAMPAAAVYLSPWMDMTLSADSYESREAKDPIHQKKMLARLAKAYLQDADPGDPLVSPVMGDLSGLPPTLIQVGDYEVGLGDAIGYADKAKGAGVPVELQVWPRMIHVFQLFWPELEEAGRAIEDIGCFIRKHVESCKGQGLA